MPISAATPSFRHDDGGNPPSIWDAPVAAAPVWHFADLARFERLVVVAPHPDDESLGAGATIASFASTGRPVSVVVCTDGAAAETGERDLGARRLGELEQALAALAGDAAELTHLGFDDGRLHGSSLALRAALRDTVLSGDLVIGPWIGDGHPDHTAAAEACRAVATSADLTLLEYPVWAWHWGDASLFEPERLVRIPHAPSAHRRKHAAIRAHRSQHAGGDPILTPQLLAHFDRPDEVFVLAAQGPDRLVRADRSSEAFFDSMHAASPDGDPWGFTVRPEEIRRLDDVVASLGDRRFGRAVEPGCSSGALTARLSPRCEHLTASDISSHAVDAARARLGAVEGVTFVHADAAATIRSLDEPVDLVVLSEVGYYLEPAQLAELVRLIAERVRPGATLLASHWTGSSEDHVLDAARTHRVIADTLGRSATTSIDRSSYEIRLWEELA